MTHQKDHKKKEYCTHGCDCPHCKHILEESLGVEKPIKTKRIITNPHVRGGVPCYEGTRIPRSLVEDYRKKGYTEADIIELFPEIYDNQ